MADSPPLRQREGGEAAAGAGCGCASRSERMPCVTHGWGLIGQRKAWAGGWGVGEEERRLTIWVAFTQVTRAAAAVPRSGSL